MKTVDRLTRVNALLKREIAGLLERGELPVEPNMLVSVTGVEASVDLRTARVDISIFGGTPGGRAKVMRALNAVRPDLQSKIARTLGFKHTPVLTFVPDDRMAAADRVLAILDGADPDDGK